MKKLFQFIHRIFSSTEPKRSSDPIKEQVRASEFVELDCWDASGAMKQIHPSLSTQLTQNRALWESGEWEDLAQLDRQTIEAQPERAELALLVAAAQLQLGQTAAAQEHLKLARTWGVDKNLMSRILIAGVHNSLGRACSIANAPRRAADHFKQSLAIAAPGTASESIGIRRGQREIAQLGIACKLDSSERGLAPLHTAFGDSHNTHATLGTIVDEQKRSSEELAAQVKRQGEEIWKMKASLERSVTKEIFKATKQIESLLELQNYMSGGEMIGELHGWPVSPDFALWMVRLLEKEAYDLVIEFGSGTSTVLIAKTLEKIRMRKGKTHVLQVAFEHLEKYHSETGKNLKQAGLLDQVHLYHAPLSEYVAPDATSWQYYECSETLSEIAKRFKIPLRILALVDGPPAVIGKHARYPALPVIASVFPNARIDILLDDYNRPDEKEIVQHWERDLTQAAMSYEVTEIPLEKGACYISIKETPHVST